MSEPNWVPVEGVIAIARRLVAETGEPFGIRDENLLGSAVSAPQNKWAYGGTEDIVELGLGLALAIARNHPFEQGNKRAGWFAMLAFFMINGYALENEDHAYYGEIFVEVITGEQPEEALLAQMRIIAFD